MTWQPEIDELRERQRLAAMMGGEERVARQKAAGKLTIRERFAVFCDPGSFHEVGSTAGVGGYDEDGKRFVREVSGFHARVVQHECDHLDGVLYPMRVRDFTRFGFNEALFPGEALPAED